MGYILVPILLLKAEYIPRAGIPFWQLFNKFAQAYIYVMHAIFSQRVKPVFLRAPCTSTIEYTEMRQVCWTAVP